MTYLETLTDESLREISRHGSADFPFAYYKEAIHQYQKGYIEWHWHQEFEWVVEPQILPYR